MDEIDWIEIDRYAPQFSIEQVLGVLLDYVTLDYKDPHTNLEPEDIEPQSNKLDIQAPEK